MLPFSRSTPRLILSKKECTIFEEKEPPPKRHASTEGRFSIIDEKCKDSSSSESFSDSDEYTTSALPVSVSLKKKTAIKIFSKSVEFVNVPKNPHMTSSTSRFRIVPVESRYKRGRWNCYDYYDKESIPSKPPKLSCPAPLRSIYPNDESVSSSPLSSRTAPTSHVNFNFEIGGSDSDRENNSPLFNQSTHGFLQSHPSIDAKKEIALSAFVKKDFSGRKTPSEVLQTGLENTLASEIQESVNKESNGFSTTSNPNGSTPQMVAIDSKIEQAMDLVKTHLMFAVREEVEILRAKIVDLEQHVVNLETENAVLRDHVPDDILKTLSLHTSH